MSMGRELAMEQESDYWYELGLAERGIWLNKNGEQREIRTMSTLYLKNCLGILEYTDGLIAEVYYDLMTAELVKRGAL